MSKSSKASLALANSILDSDVSPALVSAVSVAPKAPKAKVAAEVEAEVGLTPREVTVIKAVAMSTFADPVSGAVPSFTLAIDSEVPYGTVKGESKVNSPIPGIVASLQKKGVFNTAKVKGQTMITLSVLGKEYVELAS